MDRRQRESLDRYITGNWGEDSVDDEVVDATYESDEEEDVGDWDDLEDEAEEYPDEDESDEFTDDDDEEDE